MENLNCENKNIEGKFLRDMQKSKFLKNFIDWKIEN